MNAKPNIHLFFTPSSYYLYDSNTDMILKINQRIYEYLKAGENDDKDAQFSDVKPIVEQMQKNGLLSSNMVREIVHPADETLEYYLKNRLGMITLQVTQNCNLRCKYCVYSGNYENRSHSNLKMDFDTAKKGIDYLINHSIDRSEISIGFYGGEPLLMFDLIKQCVIYAEEKAVGKSMLFTLTTNGTLISKKIIEFFIQHDISMLISMDGPRNVHDKNRKYAGSDEGSFDTMYKCLQFIKKDYPAYFKEKIRFNTVIDPQNDFSCVNEFIMGSDLFSDSHFSSSILSDRNIKTKYTVTEDYIIKRNYEIFKLYLHMLGRLDKSYVSKILLAQYEDIKRKRGGKQNVSIKELPRKASHGGPCIPGAKRLLLNVKGDFYPCERVSESSDVMKIGNINDGIDVERARKLLNVGQISEEQCKNCWAFLYCGVCAGDADDSNKLSYEKIKSKCVSTRKNVENIFKDYCTLRELGHDFQDERKFADYSETN